MQGYIWKGSKRNYVLPGRNSFFKDGGGVYKNLINRELIIDSIYINEEFESGRCVLLRDKETNKIFTRIYDINWLIKIKN